MKVFVDVSLFDLIIIKCQNPKLVQVPLTAAIFVCNTMWSSRYQEHQQSMLPPS